MEKSQFIFSVSVGIGVLLVGAAIATKASVGITLMLLGVTLVGLATVTRHMQAEENMQVSLQAHDDSHNDLVATQHR
jgi:hypothetical protein